MSNKAALPAAVSNCGRLLTLTPLGSFAWGVIGFFWLLGFAAPFSFVLANLLLLPYYYGSLLPKALYFMRSSYGRLLLSQTERLVGLTLLASVVVLLPIPGLLHVTGEQLNAVPLWQLILILAGIHALMHILALWLTKQKVEAGMVMLVVTLYILPNGFFLLFFDHQQWFGFTLAIASLSVVAVVSKTLLASGKLSKPDVRFCWPQRIIQPSLALSLHLQQNGHWFSRFCIYCCYCFALPVIESTVYLLTAGQWQWQPADSWTLFKNMLLVIPLLCWLLQIRHQLTNLGKAWLFYPFSRQQLFYYLEHYYLRQLLLLLLPLCLLLLSHGLTQAKLLVALLLSLALLLSCTYLLLGAQTKSGFYWGYGLIFAFCIEIWPVSIQANTQSWLLAGLLLTALLLRGWAIKNWQQRDFTQAAKAVRQQDV
ncbi:hypothetical protein H1D31_16770 [Alishewanella sp. BS5-314]|uniref:hypothetical protein n=1 Tax=Alishewanella sp. BS5-314 TaxID=2755587 RepID=UPI0021BBB60F|nr:hypothetical protein [Alishewanella sp. BS5-314]MCT8127663.1 hypothetical protein [Alishewanella sp. BS5-314]